MTAFFPWAEHDSPSLLDATARIYGVVTAVVTDNKDPDGLGRVKLRFPWLADEDESAWAPVASPMAGNERGIWFLPEVEDEVLVAFLHGDLRQPFVLGALWNGKDKPPETNSDGNNDIRLIKTRSGHIVRFTDKDGSEKIEVIDKGGKNSIVIDTSGDTVTITSGKDVVIDASSGKLTLKAQDVEIKASASGKFETGSSMDLKASGQANLKGATVNIN
ncbi:MAG TPA: phage baseplate assembly protein V [Longimicrobium sp.]